MKRPLAVLAVNGALVAIATLTLVPFLWMVSASLMPTGEASQIPPRFLPSQVTFEHYRLLLTRLDLGRHLGVSLVLASAITALGLAFNSMAGYAFGKLPFAGRERIFQVLLAALVIPAQVAMLPLFLLLKALGLVNTLAGVVVPGLASVFGIFLVRQHAQGIPDSILDAARVDGAGEIRIFRSIALRLLTPILVTLALFSFMGAWNDFLWPLVVLTDDRLYTLPVALANLVGEHVQDTELVMAGAVVTVLPVVLLFVALQRYYVAGLMAGGVKG
ncbi:MAG: carbohydrate ABC transporter permease [bacterium]